MFLRHQPLQRRLVAMILVTTLAVLVGSNLVLLVYETRRSLQTTVQNLDTLSGIIASNCTAALEYDDPKLAGEILGGLTTEPDVTQAALLDRDGKLFASYPANLGPAAAASVPQNDLSHFSLSEYELRRGVFQGQTRVGSLFIRSDLGEMYRRLGVYLWVLLGVLSGAILFALYLSRVFQRQISEPITHLAETARRVSEGKDFSVRAQKRSEDEVGVVTDAFNTMLGQIQLSHAALAERETQMRLMTDNAAVFLCQIDRTHRFVFVNRAYSKRYGLEPKDIIGKPVWEVIGAEAYAMIRDRLNLTLAGYRDESELEIPYSSLGKRWIHTVYEPVRHEDGSVVGVVAVLSDITERRLAALEVARARDEALRASRAKDDFLAALSHELRTPLNPILLLASDAATNPELSPDIRADFDTVRRNVEIEARLIDDLLDHTRITNGKLVLRDELVDADTILQEALRNARPDLDAKQLEVSLKLSAVHPTVKADPVRLQQAFWNVLKNAAKFTPPGGQVWVTSTVSDEAKTLTVQVRDTGLGMTPDELGHVFQAFVQGEHARGPGHHRYGGLGLGLSISRSMIELQGGKIRAESPGRDLGSTFSIELPLAVLPRSPGVAPEALAQDGGTGQRARKGASILLVEDHAPTRIVLGDLLRKRGYQVVAAASVNEARTMASNEPVDIVLSDIGLPDGNGYELMAELRLRHHVTGIALTGYGMVNDLAQSRAAGFVAHLTKPIGSQALDVALATADAARKFPSPPP